jgi:LysM repeat protein
MSTPSLRTASITILSALAGCCSLGCTGAQVAADPSWTPAVIIVTPTVDRALVEATPTPLDIPTEVYQIRRGETLTQIAERYGLTVEQLAALNGIDDPNSIEVGQRIRVPRLPR